VGYHHRRAVRISLKCVQLSSLITGVCRDSRRNGQALVRYFEIRIFKRTALCATVGDSPTVRDRRRDTGANVLIKSRFDTARPCHVLLLRWLGRALDGLSVFRNAL